MHRFILAMFMLCLVLAGQAREGITVCLYHDTVYLPFESTIRWLLLPAHYDAEMFRGSDKWSSTTESSSRGHTVTAVHRNSGHRYTISLDQSLTGQPLQLKQVHPLSYTTITATAGRPVQITIDGAPAPVPAPGAVVGNLANGWPLSETFVPARFFATHFGLKIAAQAHVITLTHPTLGSELAVFPEAKDAKDVQQLIRFVAQGDVKSAGKLLRDKPYLLQARDGESETPLLSFAVMADSADMVNCLLELKADAGAPDMIGLTPLHFAGGNEAITRRLIEAGANVNAVSRWGITPLHNAVMAKNAQVAQALLDAGATPNVYGYIFHGTSENSNDYDAGPLHLAVALNRRDIVELLLAHGADTNAKGSKYVRHPLALAAEFGNANMVRLLLDHDATPPPDLLHAAVLHRKPDIVSLLLDRGVDVNAANKEGERPVMLAAQGWAGAAWDPELVKLLIARGADVRVTRKSGETLLHLIAGNGHLELLRLVLDKGADVNAMDARKQTPLDYAEKNHATGASAYLREHGGKRGNEAR